VRLFIVFCVLSVPAGAQWLNYKTPGIPRLADGKANLSAPAPKTAEGKPDLAGVRAAECAIYDGNPCFTRSLFFDLARDLKPGDVEMTPGAAGRPLPDGSGEPTWLGYSVGRWDNDAFVVDTNGFRDGGWIDTKKARPNSDALREPHSK
jgi:hypothetical protein